MHALAQEQRTTTAHTIGHRATAGEWIAELVQELLEDGGRRSWTGQQYVQNSPWQLCAAVALDEQLGQRRLASARLAITEEAEWLAAAIDRDGHVDLRQALLEGRVDHARRPQPFGRR